MAQDIAFQSSFWPSEELWGIAIERVRRWAWFLAAAAVIIVHRRLRKIKLGFSFSWSSKGEVSVELKTPMQIPCEKKQETSIAHGIAEEDSFAARDFAESDAGRCVRGLLEILAEADFVCKGVDYDRDREDDNQEGGEDEEEGDLLEASWSFKVPEWANSLLQPLMPSDGSQEQWWKKKESDARSWDAVLEMHAEAEAGLDWKTTLRSIFDRPSAMPRTIISKGPRYLAKAKNEVVKLWGSSKQKLLESWSLPDDQGMVSALDVSDGWEFDVVAAGSSDGYLNLWDVATSQCVRSFQATRAEISINSVRMISPVPRGIYCSSDAIALWDVRDRKVAIESFAAGSTGVEWMRTHEFCVRRHGSEDMDAYDVRMAARLSQGIPLPRSSDVCDRHLVDQQEEEIWWDAIEEQDKEEEDDDEDEVVHSPSGGKRESFFARCVALISPCV